MAKLRGFFWACLTEEKCSKSTVLIKGLVIYWGPVFFTVLKLWFCFIFCYHLHLRKKKKIPCCFPKPCAWSWNNVCMLEFGKKKKGKKHVISDWILSSLDKPNPWLTGANLSNIQLPTQICKGEPRGKIHCQPLLQVSVFVYHVRI